MSIAQGPTPATTASAPIRIGLNCPFTTGSSDMGLSVRAALRVIQRELNEVGGILGSRVELVERDDRAAVEVGKAVAEELTRSGVLLTIGYCNTGVAAASIETYQKARVPLIIPVASGTTIANRFAPPAADKNFIFRTSMPDIQQVMFMVEAITKRGWNRVALFADTSGYGEAGKKDLESELAKRGLAPVHVERFEVGVTDLRPALRRAQAAGANVIFTYAPGPEVAVISRGRAESKWQVPMVGTWTVGFGNHLEKAQSAADGALMPQTFLQDGKIGPDRQAFVRSIRRELAADRIPCAMCAAQAYDAMQLAVRAIAQARARGLALTPETIRDQLEQLDRQVKGIVTSYEQPFSTKDHEAMTRNMLVMGVVRNGRVAFENPEDELRTMIPQRKLSALKSTP